MVHARPNGMAASCTSGWLALMQGVPTRAARQCRERWENVLRPDVLRAPFTAAEVATLTRLAEQQMVRPACPFASLPALALPCLACTPAQHPACGMQGTDLGSTSTGAAHRPRAA